MILLVRHGVALRRHEWDGPDRYRPLAKRGHKQAAALVDLLAPYAPARVISSPATRCIETVQPLAKAAGVDVEEVEELWEGHGTDALDLVLSYGTWRSAPGSIRQNGGGEGALVVSTHGDVLPELLVALAGHLGTLPLDPPCAKASTWVLDSSSARYLPPPA